MKLYTSRLAPNPRRVTIFLAEKGIEVPTVEIDLAKQENLVPEFLGRNPLGRVPVLEFDDGSHLSESVAICRYFDYTGPIDHQPPRPADVRRHRGDVTRAQDILGFSPKVSLDEGIRRTLDWYTATVESATPKQTERSAKGAA